MFKMTSSSLRLTQVNGDCETTETSPHLGHSHNHVSLRLTEAPMKSSTGFEFNQPKRHHRHFTAPSHTYSILNNPPEPMEGGRILNSTVSSRPARRWRPIRSYSQSENPRADGMGSWIIATTPPPRYESDTITEIDDKYPHMGDNRQKMKIYSHQSSIFEPRAHYIQKYAQRLPPQSTMESVPAGIIKATDSWSTYARPSELKEIPFTQAALTTENESSTGDMDQPSRHAQVASNDPNSDEEIHMREDNQAGKQQSSVMNEHKNSSDERRLSGYTDDSPAGLLDGTPRSTSWRTAVHNTNSASASHAIYCGVESQDDPGDDDLGGKKINKISVVDKNPREAIQKFIFALLFLAMSWVISSYSVTLADERSPDPMKHKPLPDIFIDNFRRIPWAAKLSEVTIVFFVILFSILIVFHKCRRLIVQRCFIILALLYLFRALTIWVTSMPIVGSHLVCTDKRTFTITDRLHRMAGMFMNQGMEIYGSQMCGDYIFSGHTCMLVVLAHFLTEYSPKRLWPLHVLIWSASGFGAFCILAGHFHYTVDVILAIVIASRLFTYYHVMCYCPALFTSPLKDRFKRIFPLFYFFEDESTCQDTLIHATTFELPSLIRLPIQKMDFASYLKRNAYARKNGLEKEARSTIPYHRFMSTFIQKCRNNIKSRNMPSQWQKIYTNTPSVNGKIEHCIKDAKSDIKSDNSNTHPCIISNTSADGNRQSVLFY